MNGTASLSDSDPVFRLFNESVWSDFTGRISSFTTQYDNLDTYEVISQVLTDTLSSLSPDIAGLFLPVYHKAIAITNIVLDELQQAFDSKLKALLFGIDNLFALINTVFSHFVLLICMLS